MTRAPVHRLVPPALAAAVLLAAPAARGQGPTAAELRGPERAAPSEVVWDPRWPRFRTAEYVATGIMGAMAFASLAIPPSEGRWTEVNAFDASVRGAVRIKSPRLRVVARDASDLVIGLMINHLSVDVLLVTWWGHGRGSVAWELAMMDAEAMTVNAALNGLIAGLTSRERPYRDECTGPVERQNNDCRDTKRYRSFFSGHSSTAFTAAGLTCSHHAHLPLYGGGAPDVLACVASFAAATTVATLRVVSDQHFATDAITGAAMGTLTGLGLPWLLHYRGGAPEDAGARRAGGVSLRLVPGPMGGALMGTF